MKIQIPIWEKLNLTLEEASAYSGIGVKTLKLITNETDCDFVLWVGKKRMIKRDKFKKYLEYTYSMPTK